MPTTSSMTDTYVSGIVIDVRGRARFVPANALVTPCTDTALLVINDQGHFFIPNLEPGRTYEFIAYNGSESKRWRVTPKRGANRSEVVVKTKPVRLTKGASAR